MVAGGWRIAVCVLALGAGACGRSTKVELRSAPADDRYTCDGEPPYFARGGPDGPPVHELDDTALRSAIEQWIAADPSRSDHDWRLAARAPSAVVFLGAVGTDDQQSLRAMRSSGSWAFAEPVACEPRRVRDGRPSLVWLPAAGVVLDDGSTALEVRVQGCPSGPPDLAVDESTVSATFFGAPSTDCDREHTSTTLRLPGPLGRRALLDGSRFYGTTVGRGIPGGAKQCGSFEADAKSDAVPSAARSRHWADARGCLMPLDRISTRVSRPSDHCVHPDRLVHDDRTFVRDVDGSFPGTSSAGYLAAASPPPTAVDTRLRSWDGATLLLDATAPDRAYLRYPDRIEQWPATDHQPSCA